MLKYFLQLNLPLTANDDEIRKQYLHLIKIHTPEADPVQFQTITTAYEKIKTLRSRIRTRLFDAFEEADPEQALVAISRARKPEKKRVALDELFAAPVRKNP